MSNRENGFQGSIPFITDKEFQNLSLAEIQHIIKQEKENLIKDHSELKQRQRLIKQYKKLVEARNKVRQGIDIKKKYKKSKPKKIKTFEEYFEECLKNKKIPKDTPKYLRKAIERALYEHEEGIKLKKSALNKFVTKHSFPGIPGLSPPEYLNRVQATIENFITNNRNDKIRMCLICIMERISVKTDKGVEKVEQDNAYFCSKTYRNLESTDPGELVRKCFGKIMEDIMEYNTNGSGWYFNEVIELEITTTEFNPTKGSSYIPLPNWLTNKKAIVNIKNKDDKCFLWCILRYLHPRDRDNERLTDLRKYEFSLNTKEISFPMSLKDISKFEKLNPELPGINVFSVDVTTIYPLRMAERDCKNTIDLFLIEEDGVSHYSLIKNFSRLIRSQITTRTEEPIQICKRCFSHFTKEELLDKHIKYCYNNATAVVKMPEPNTMLYFKNYHKQLPIPFVVYADFECFTKPMNTCSPNPKDSYNYNYQKHEPSGFCFYVKGIVDKKLNQSFIQKLLRTKM